MQFTLMTKEDRTFLENNGGRVPMAKKHTFGLCMVLVKEGIIYYYWHDSLMLGVQKRLIPAGWFPTKIEKVKPLWPKIYKTVRWADRRSRQCKRCFEGDVQLLNINTKEYAPPDVEVKIAWALRGGGDWNKYFKGIPHREGKEPEILKGPDVYCLRPSQLQT